MPYTYAELLVITDALSSVNFNSHGVDMPMLRGKVAKHALRALSQEALNDSAKK